MGLKRYLRILSPGFGGFSKQRSTTLKHAKFGVKYGTPHWKSKTNGIERPTFTGDNIRRYSDKSEATEADIKEMHIGDSNREREDITNSVFTLNSKYQFRVLNPLVKEFFPQCIPKTRNSIFIADAHSLKTKSFAENVIHPQPLEFRPSLVPPGVARTQKGGSIHFISDLNPLALIFQPRIEKAGDSNISITNFSCTIEIGDPDSQLTRSPMAYEVSAEEFSGYITDNSDSVSWPQIEFPSKGNDLILDSTPFAHAFSNPVLSDLGFTEDLTQPIAYDLATPLLSDLSSIDVNQPKAHVLDPCIKCFIPSVECMNPLNHSANCVVPNASPNPMCTNNYDICSEDDALDITPGCFTCNTPDLSLLYSESCDRSIVSNESPSNCIIPQNWTDNRANTQSMAKSNLNPDASLFIPSLGNNSDNEEENSPYSILKTLRIKNMNKIIFGHLNINSIRNKFDLLADLVKSRIDVILVSETKLDKTFPNSQFRINGYSPLRLDRTDKGGGLLLYIRSDIPSKPLPLLGGKIECIISQVTISKKKWLVLGIYNPKKSIT